MESRCHRADRLATSCKARQCLVATGRAKGMQFVSRRCDKRTICNANEVFDDRPKWTGDTVVSNLVNAAISNPFLFGLMKLGARQQMQSAAEKKGIAWKSVVKDLQNNARLGQLYSQVQDPNVQFPSYYTVAFHGYDSGNLNWLAAFEVEPATDAMALIVYKKELDIQPQEAQDKMRNGIYSKVLDYMSEAGCREVKTALDAACSAGISTRSLAKKFPEAQVLGMDLSPYFLAVAELREEEIQDSAKHPGYKRIQYIHGNVEDCRLNDESIDLVSCQYLAHELPAVAVESVIAEFARILKPGGVAFLVDTDPKSQVLQNLPAPIFTLMKSTEPWADEYFTFDFEECFCKHGFKNVKTVSCNPRHRVIMGKK
eukprot:jgi/Picsp_1/5410/NSC_02769-R1_cmv 1a interacting protein 1